MTRPILHRQVSWTDAASYMTIHSGPRFASRRLRAATAIAKPDLYASLAAVTLPDPKGRAMPSARAADASHSSLLRVSTRGGIAIAAFALLYFGGELLRAVLS